MKKLAFIPVLFFALFGVASAAGDGTIGQLQQWTSTSSPSTSITQSVYGKAIQITGLTNGSCLKLDSNGILTSTSCGGGGGGSFPFSSDTNFNQVVYSTSTPTLWFKSGVFASSTSAFDNASTTFETLGTLWLKNIVSGALGTLANGQVYKIATSTPTATGGLTYSGVLGNFLGGTSGNLTLATLGSAGVLGAQTATTPTVQATSTLYGTGAAGQILMFNGAGLTPVSTTTFANGSGITNTFAGNQNTIALASISAGVLGSAVAGIPTSQATSTLYGTGTNGTVLSWNGGIPSWVATTTFSAGSNVTLTQTGNSISIAAASSGGGSFPFSADNNFNQVVYSTSTPTLWFKSGVFASSTSKFDQLQLGSSTALSLTNSPLVITGNTNSYVQAEIQNKSTGNNASSVYVVTSDKGTDSTYYGEFGINNSGYTNASFSSQNAGDSFLTSSDGGLVIGTASSTYANADLRFTTGGTASSSIRSVITAAGLFGIGTTSPYGQLSVNAPGGTAPYFVIGSSTSEVFKISPSTGTNGSLKISTTTSGCATFSSTGILYSNGSACGSAAQAVSTSSSETAGQLAVWGTTSGTPAKLYSVASTSISCTGALSCTGFNAFGAASSINLASISSGVLGSAASGVPSAQATSTLYGAGAAGQVLMFTGTGLSMFATTTFANGSGITNTFAGNQDTIALASISAGVLGSAVSGIPTSQATSSLYGTGTNGQVLSWNGGVPSWVATTTFSAGSNITLTQTGNSIAIAASGGGTGLSTTSPIASSNLLVYSATGNGSAFGVATTSATCGSGISCTGFNVLGSANPSFALAALGSAGVLGAVTATTPTVQATSTLYGTGFNFNNTAGGFSSFGTTTPFGFVSINPTSAITTSPQFVVGSSTATALLINNAGQIAVGTTTTTYPLDIYANAAPQLSLSAGGGFAKWAFANVGGNFTLSTTTVAGTATTSTAALTINATSKPGFGIGTTSTGAWATLAVNPSSGDFPNAFVIGSSTATTFIVDNAGRVGVGTTTPWGLLSINPIVANGAMPQFVVGSTSSTTMIITAGGKTGFGTTSPYRIVSISGTVAMQGLTTASGAQTGDLCINAANDVINDSSVCIVSARRFKNDIMPLSSTDALAEVLKLQPVSFRYKPEFNGSLQSNPNYNGEQIGFIADDVQKIDPRLVTIETADSDGAIPSKKGDVASFRYLNSVALLTGAIQALNDKIDGKGLVRSAEENWQNTLIGLLVLYVIYNEIRRKRT